jgi:hypothetical protein
MDDTTSFRSGPDVYQTQIALHSCMTDVEGQIIDFSLIISIIGSNLVINQ